MVGIAVATLGAGVPCSVGVCKDKSGLLDSCEESLVSGIVREVGGVEPGRSVWIGMMVSLG